MIIKEFKVQDVAYKKYTEYNTKDPEAAMGLQLVRFQEVKPSSRIIIIGEKERVELETLFDRFLDTGQDVITQCKRALTMKIEGVELQLSPDQMERIKLMAEFEGKDFKLFLAEKLKDAVKLTLEGYM